MSQPQPSDIPEERPLQSNQQPVEQPALPQSQSTQILAEKQNQQAIHNFDNIMQENIEYNGNEGYMDDEQNSITSYMNRIRDLQQKEEILKYSVSDHQQTVKQLFMTLYNKKKRLLELIIQEYNTKNFNVDIGLMEQFQQMRKTIQNQETKIQKLKTEIQMQGLTGLKNDRDTIKLKQKKEELQSEIQGGRHFAASQYVRDYLQRTYIHKVSYQDVKYEYQMKIKLKECLEAEKQAYDKKKEELKKAIERENLLKRELQEEKARLQLLNLPRQGKQTNGK